MATAAGRTPRSAVVCRTCGVQQPDRSTLPPVCPICADARQYVAAGGQRWATLDELLGDGYRTEVRWLEAGLMGIGVRPELGIGQRSLVVVTEGGNVLWDVAGFVDEAAMAAVDRLGGLAAVSASHPHFYGVMGEWADEFDVPAVLPEVDVHWLARPPRRVEVYADAFEVVPGVRLIRTGGHFPGSAVAHWPAGADGRGVLLTGDSLHVVADRRWLSFMWSYPNLIPLDLRSLDGIEAALTGRPYDRIYGGWWDDVIVEGGQEAVARSLARYRTAITDTAQLERREA